MAPAGSRSKKKIRKVEVTYTFADAGARLEMKTKTRKTSEEVSIFIDPEDRFLTGSKTVKKKSGKLKFEGMIWRDGMVARAKKLSWSGWTLDFYKLHPDRPLAVDASLIYLLRSFPFDTDKEWDIYMIDFSQRSITVTARQKGIETVKVPAGEFECYRIEVRVNLFIFHPRITYWLLKDDPHYLVKHRGMIGPFTRTYVTELLSREQHD
jgi:hypothetical protein